MPTNNQDRGPRIRAGGIYPSKDGRSFVGSINVTYVDRDGNILGDRLIAMIEEAMEQKVPVRALMFPPFDNRQDDRPQPPYTLYFAFGQPRSQDDREIGKRAPVEPPRASTADSTAQGRMSAPDSEAGLPSPEPTPRRRVPPTRSPQRSNR